ncbi:MAG: glycosyl hydrolase family 28-related protein, partial [Stellaceae bacterium]
GRTDDTKAILAAIAAADAGDTGRTFWHDRFVYIPDGTYLVSDSLLKRDAAGRFGSGLVLVGQSQRNTVIRLADHATGFGDATHPRAVIFTSSKLLDTGGGKNYRDLGEGNDAYMNFVKDLTVDVGAGNPGAVGIDYLANNIGAIRNVTLRAGQGSGAVGLSLMRKWPGPALIKNLAVEGFDIGIAIAQTEYGLTFDHVVLEGQRSVSLRNEQNALAIRDLTIRRTPHAIVNSGAKAFIAIEDSKISGDIVNDGIVTASDSKLDARTVTGVLQHGNWTENHSLKQTSRFRDLPDMTQSPKQGWANILHFGATGDPGADSTSGLRRALASGAATVYLPHGVYAIGDTIDIPRTVRRIVGFNTAIKVLPHRQPHFARDNGMFRIVSDGAALSIEGLIFDNTGMGQQVAIEVDGPRSVVVRDVVGEGVTLLDRKTAGGPTSLEDVCCGLIKIAGLQPVFAEQLDTEGGGVRIQNLGGTLSILGLKTEGINTVLDNRDGARTRIFGGLIYMVRANTDASLPAFRNDNSWLTASFAEEVLRPDARYHIYVSDGSRTIGADRFPERGLGRIVPNLRLAPRTVGTQ